MPICKSYFWCSDNCFHILKCAVHLCFIQLLPAKIQILNCIWLQNWTVFVICVKWLFKMKIIINNSFKKALLTWQLFSSPELTDHLLTNFGQFEWADIWQLRPGKKYHIRRFLQFLMVCFNLLYFIEYNVHTSIVRTWISQWFLAKKIIFIFQE